MKNILFVSIAFPPKLDPECIQTGRYYKYLVQNHPELQFQVATSASPTRFMPVSEDLQTFLPKNNPTIELKLFEPRLLHALVNKALPMILQFPDSKYSFALQWRKVIKQLRTPPDLIYSRSYPLSSTLMALKLHKHFGVPWVMHLSDPWTDSPLHRYHGLSYRVNTAWERSCFSQASYITLTSEKTVEFYRKKFPHWANKFIYLPNVYDPANLKLPARKNSPSQKLRFVYTGGLANTRTAEPILTAIAGLRKNQPELLERCEFIWAGDMDSRNRTLFERYADPAISHLGALGYREALDLQKSADVLIAIDSKIASNASAMFFPSKLLDYWTTGHRLLALTTPGSTTDEFVKKYQLGTAVYFNTGSEAITDTLAHHVQQHMQKNTTFFTISPPDKVFAADYNAGRLAEIFNSL